MISTGVSCLRWKVLLTKNPPYRFTALSIPLSDQPVHRRLQAISGVARWIDFPSARNIMALTSATRRRYPRILVDAFHTLIFPHRSSYFTQTFSNSSIPFTLLAIASPTSCREVTVLVLLKHFLTSFSLLNLVCYDV